MTKKPRSERAKNPAGMAMRDLLERTRQGRQRDPASKQQNKLAQPQNRWQRAVRYNWDKNRGRG
jgi:hypothetical protein